MSNFASNTPPTVPEAWRDYAARLADWTEGNLLNRTDAWVQYLAHHQRAAHGTKSLTVKDSELSREALIAHYRGEDVGFLIGLHTTTPPTPGLYDGFCMCRWCALDHDKHGDDPAAPDMFPQALQAWEETRDWGSLLYDSNGRGGYHNFLLFDDIRRTEEVFQFARWWGEEAAHPCEFFPKQPSLKPAGRRGHYGNVLRLPGRHHTHDHWTKVWDGRRWLEGEDAIRVILATTGSGRPFPSFITPADQYAQEATERRRAAFERAERTGDVSADTLQSALDALADAGLVNDYAVWLEVGMALRDRGDEGFRLWDEWSRAGVSYDATVCENKWASFAAGGGLTVATVFHRARSANWTGKSSERLQHERLVARMEAYRAGRAGRPVEQAAAVAVGIEEPIFRAQEGPQEAEPADPPVATGEAQDGAENPADDDAGATWLFRNYFTVPGESVGREIKLALRTPDIEQSLVDHGGGWPKIAAGKLFVASRRGRPVFLDNTTKFLAWVDRVATVAWVDGPSFVSRDRFFESLRVGDRLESYEAVQCLPHWPPMADTYYLCEPVGAGTGEHLARLIDRFAPATPVDRDLLQAMLLTFFWGGECGKRPAFLVTGPDAKQEGKRGGRGVGKSTAVDLLARLAGGILAVNQKDNMREVVTRMLSPLATQLRVARVDNIKTNKLSWADLEGLITSHTVSGRELYNGEGRRPNIFTWVFTQNGGGFSSDMAQRTIMIRLARPVYNARWQQQTEEFIDHHRDAILADIRDLLLGRVEDLPTATRWAEWEHGVLARCGDLAACQEVIRERQGEMNEDQSERELVLDRFREEMTRAGRNPDADRVRLSPADCLAVLRDILGEDGGNRMTVMGASTRIKSYGFAELTQLKGGREGRGWLWEGPDSDPTAAIVPLYHGEKSFAH